MIVNDALSKLDAFDDFFAPHRAFVASYRYVFIADDDLAFASGVVSESLRTWDRQQLFLMQPVFLWRSWFNRQITGRFAFTIFRYVSLMERMVRVLSRESPL
jgi:hypothetical protein